jgi:hypothetical protein
MNSLQGFWRWFETERPRRVTSRDLDALSGNGKSALSYAAEQVFLRDSSCAGMEVAIRRYPEAVRRLSIMVCAALDEMCQALPDKPAKVLCEHGVVKVDERTQSCVCQRCGTVLVVSAADRAAADGAPRAAGARDKHR